ncbi:lysophospholipid acyltransferase family protein [Luteococcus sp.]|uniref:lysophospholipid acyltransferase family protein n=1 Tax=Luteococcus sp. TaxID=1969402 RepID=UPI003734C56F
MTSEPSSTVEGRRGCDRAGGEPTYRFLGQVARGLNTLIGPRLWLDQHKVPASGAVLVVSNHISKYDPLVLGDYLISSGRWPRFLGKSDLWSTPVVGFFARGCRQIPVERNTIRAGDSLKAAREALDAGEMVAIYPEGTITADPETWPMTARTGAARLALETRCPVLPVGQWGANHFMPGKKLTHPRVLPRKPLLAKAGDLLDLSDLYDAPDRHQAVRVASERMMEAITRLTAELRQEQAPEDRYDIRKKQRVPKGSTSLADPDEQPPVQPGVL